MEEDLAQLLQSSGALSPTPVTEQKNDIDFKSFINNALNEATNIRRKDYDVGYSDVANLDPYQYQKHYDPQGFNPEDNLGNSTRYQNMETMSSTLGKAFNDFGYKFSNSFSEYWESYARMGKAFINADLSHLDPSQNELISKYYEDHINEMKNKVFMKPEEEDDFFNKQFLKDFLGNAGFTLGTLGAVSLELMGDMVLEAVTSGAASPLIAARMGKLGKTIADLGKGFKLADATADQIKALRSTMAVTERGTVHELARLSSNSKVKSVVADHLAEIGSLTTGLKNTSLLKTKFGKALEQIPILGSGIQTAERLAVAGEAGLSTATKVGMGIMGFKRSLTEFNMASSEAAFEAVSTYGSTLDSMLTSYENKYGELPKGDDLKQLKNLAMSAATNNYDANLMILMISNKIQFGNLFSKLGVTNKAVQDYLQNKVSDIRFVGKGAKGLFYRSGSFLKDLSSAGKIAKTLGKKEALKVMGKSVGRSLLRFEATEGFQENLQETSNEAWKDYYTNMYSRDPASLFHSVKEGLGSQFSQQGLKTFMLGAFTGLLVGPVTSSMETLTEQGTSWMYKIKGQKDPRLEREKQYEADLSEMNKFITPEQVFNANIFNIKVQEAASNTMSRAAAINDSYEFQDAKENALLAAAKTHHRNNTMDAFTKQLRAMGADFTNDEFEQAFGINPANTEFNNPAAFANYVADDLERFAKLQDEIKTNFPKFIEVEELMLQHYGMMKTYDEYADIIAYNQVKGEKAIKRAKDLSHEILKNPVFAGSSDYVTRVLADPNQISTEINLLYAEIRGLEESIKATAIEPTDTKEDRARKKQDEEELTRQSELKVLEIQRLSEFKQMFQENPNYNKEVKGKKDSQTHLSRLKPDVTIEQLQKQLAHVMNNKNAQAGLTPGFIDHETALKFNDFVTLEQDSKDYIEASAIMRDPDAFRATLPKMLDGQFKAYIVHVIRSVEVQAEMLDAMRFLSKQSTNPKEVTDKILASENYKKLLAILISDVVTVDKVNYITGLADDLHDEVLEEKNTTTILATQGANTNTPNPANTNTTPVQNQPPQNQSPQNQSPGANPGANPVVPPGTPPAGSTPSNSSSTSTPASNTVAPANSAAASPGNPVSNVTQSNAVIPVSNPVETNDDLDVRAFDGVQFDQNRPFSFKRFPIQGGFFVVTLKGNPATGLFDIEVSHDPGTGALTAPKNLNPDTNKQLEPKKAKEVFQETLEYFQLEYEKEHPVIYVKKEEEQEEEEEETPEEEIPEEEPARTDEDEDEEESAVGETIDDEDVDELANYITGRTTTRKKEEEKVPEEEIPVVFEQDPADPTVVVDSEAKKPVTKKKSSKKAEEEADVINNSLAFIEEFNQFFLTPKVNAFLTANGISVSDAMLELSNKMYSDYNSSRYKTFKSYFNNRAFNFMKDALGSTKEIIIPEVKKKNTKKTRTPDPAVKPEDVGKYPETPQTDIKIEDMSAEQAKKGFYDTLNDLCD